MCFGSSGMFEQDDVENWTSITSASQGKLAATVPLVSTMGMGPDGGTLHDPVSSWPGPGRAFIGYGEYNQREWLRRWSDAVQARDDPGRANGRSDDSSGRSGVSP